MQEEQFVLEDTQMPAQHNRGSIWAGFMAATALLSFNTNAYCEEKFDGKIYSAEYNSAKHKWDKAHLNQEQLASTGRDKFQSFIEENNIQLSEIQKHRINLILSYLVSACENDVEFALGGDDEIIIAKTTELGTKYLFISIENYKPAFSYASATGQVNTRGFDNNNEGVIKAVKHFLLA